MKKILKTVSVFMVILLVFSSCAKSKDYDENFTQKGREIISHFGKNYNYKYFLKDISSIDLDLKPDFDNKKYTVKKGNGDGTVQYYKNGRLVYEDFQDIGERGFINYTKTKSGADAKVYYYLDENNRAYNVVVKTDAYTVNINLQNKSENNDLQNVIITAEKKAADKLSETIMYSAYDGFIIVEKAMYCSREGYIDYSSWVDIDNKLQETVDVKFAVLNSPTDEDTVKKIKSDLDISMIQTLMGCHKLAYKGSKWFITTDLYVLFSGETEANEYAEKNGIGKENISNEHSSDGGTFYVLYKDITLPISDKFLLNGEGDLNELAAAEFNDLTFADITVNDSGEVTAIEYNNSILSCY